MISIYAIYKAGESIPAAQAAMRPSPPRISCLASNSDSLYPTGGESLPAVQAATRPELLRISCYASNSDSHSQPDGESLPLVRTSLRPTPSAELKRRPATPCSNLSASIQKFNVINKKNLYNEQFAQGFIFKYKKSDR